MKHASSLLMVIDTLVLLWPPKEVVGTSIRFPGSVYQFYVVQFGATTTTVVFFPNCLRECLASILERWELNM